MPAKWRVLLAIALIATFFATAPVVALEHEAPGEVVAAASEGLQKFLKLVPHGELEHFGFNDLDELSRATIGDPFMVYTMRPAEILAAVEGKPVDALIRPTGMWQFPVVSDDTPRTLLTVANMKGEWKAVDLGGLSPAIEMRGLALRWPPSQGYLLRYVRVFQTGSQFVWVTKDAADHLVPLEQTARTLGMLEQGESFEYRPMEIGQALDALAPFVRSSLENTRR